MSVCQTPPGEGGGTVSLYLAGTQRSVTGVDSQASINGIRFRRGGHLLPERGNKPVEVIRVEGDSSPEKKRIAAEVRGGVELFLSLDMQRLQDARNARREQILRALATYRDDDFLAPFHRGLPNTTASRTRQEIARPFQLVAAPQPIIINLNLDDHPQAPNAPAFVVSGDVRYVGAIFVLANNIDPVGLCARDTRQPLVDVAFHEMLHLCGDAVKEEDGVVRHQLAGTEVVRMLLGLPQRS